MKKVIFFAALLLFTAGVSLRTVAQALADYRKETYASGNDTLLYRILLPEGFDASKKYPLLFVLHGSGERGNDNEAQLIHGANTFIQPQFKELYKAIIIFPQCPKNSYWSNVDIQRDSNNKVPAVFSFKKDGDPTPPMHALIKLVKHMQHEPYVDKKRIYVGGLSMGGMGTFEILWRQPKVFAAAFPICGGGNPATAKKFAKKVPVWVFHGGKDNVVLPKYSEDMVRAIKEAGGNPKFTIYPEANHNSWDNAFAEPQLFAWLFSHHK